ncbi:phosphodiester glycosidase family protein [Leptolyngbya sp. FACHB-261]|uniref:phosphodiester glycosidase family protein n=1 Tax=Leptolyngbya sp. FACHB-261 TaxID=2692806 RepID=UPI0028C37CE6|nr:phosphodiester glycosidase family protein [Leptolyngbya sp. FACHB-261]
MASPPAQTLQYNTHSLEQSLIHTLLIPSGSRFSVLPALSQSVEPLADFAQKYQAVAVLNGGFFDPQNRKSTSYLVLQGQIVADPRLNERLMNSDRLAPYLPKILNRSEFRRYRCEAVIHYDIALHSEPLPLGCQLVDAIGGGPRLLPELTSVEEGFTDFANGQMIRDAIGSSQPNARTAVGITQDGSVLWVMVAQTPEAPATSGLSLPELANFMKSLGVQKAMNLDGGSSSSLYYNGQTFYGKVNQQGEPVQRPVKSVLLLQS